MDHFIVDHRLHFSRSRTLLSHWQWLCSFFSLTLTIENENFKKIPSSGLWSVKSQKKQHPTCWMNTHNIPVESLWNDEYAKWFVITLRVGCFWMLTKNSYFQYKFQWFQCLILKQTNSHLFCGFIAMLHSVKHIKLTWLSTYPYTSSTS